MRIRTIKPSFWRSDDITALPMDVRLLFIGLWSYVDDNGVGLDDYREIAADLFAKEDDPAAIREFVREGLATLSRGLLVVRYKIDNKSYLFIPTWDEHQKVDRPGKSRYPRPPEGFNPSTSRNGHHSDHVARRSRDDREAIAPVVGVKGEKGRRGEGESPCAAAENLTPDRAGDHEPPQPALPEPAPGPAVTGPTAADAYRLVDRTIGREHPHAVRTALAIEAQSLIIAGIYPDLVTAALALWLEKPHLGPRSLPSLVSEVIRAQNKPTKVRASASDTALAEVDAAFAEYENQTIAPILRALPGGA